MKSFIEQKYHIKSDPFPSNVALPNDPMVGRDKEFKQLITIANRFIGGSSNASNFIIGDYGTGKTLMLYKLDHELKKQGSILSIILKLLPEDKVKRFGMDFIQRIFARVDFPSLRFSPKALQDLATVLPDESKVFGKAVEGDTVALQILRGEGSVTKKEMADLGVRRKIVNTESAIRFWNAFLFLIHSAGVETIILGIDEVEYLASQVKGGAGIAEVFNTLRDLHDLANMPKPVKGNFANVICFFAISEDGWRTINMVEKREKSKGGPMNPFLRRLSAAIVLKSFTEDETQKLIEGRLSAVRAAGQKREPLIPFNESFVKFIFKVTNGVPHHIVRYCHVILRQGMEESVPMLTKDYAKKVLMDSGLYSDEQQAG